MQACGNGVARAAHFDHTRQPVAVAAAPKRKPMRCDGLGDERIQEVIKPVRVRTLDGDWQAPLSEFTQMSCLTAIVSSWWVGLSPLSRWM